MSTLRQLLFILMMMSQFGYVMSEAPVVSFGLKVDWIGEREYLRGEGLQGKFYQELTSQ